MRLPAIARSAPRWAITRRSRPSRPSASIRVTEALQGTSLASDRPSHAVAGRRSRPISSHESCAASKKQISARAEALVCELAAGGGFEAIDGLARAFPLEIVADLIGFTGQVKANMLRWGQAAMEDGSIDPRTMENFLIAGELYGWCSQVTANDLSEGSVGRGIFDAEARGEIPAGCPATSSTNTLEVASTRRSRLSEISSRCSVATPTSSSACGKTPPWFRRPSTRSAALLRAHTCLGATRLPHRGDRRSDVAGRRARRHPFRRWEPGRAPATQDDPDVFNVARDPSDHLSFGYRSAWLCRAGTGAYGRSCRSSPLSPSVCVPFKLGEAVKKPSNLTQSFDKLPVYDVAVA